MLIKLLKTIFRYNHRKASESQIQAENNNSSLAEGYIGEWYDSKNDCKVSAYEIPFMKGPSSVWIYIGFDFSYVKIICSTIRSVSAPGFDDSGSVSYDFPLIESLDYLNVIAFLQEHTYLGGNLNGELITREEYESILSIIGYVE